MSSTEKDLQCRELIAKAVCGKGHKYSQSTHTIIPSHTPSTILGCWVINTQFRAEKEGEAAVEVSGTCDVNLWYSYADNTQTEVKKEQVDFSILVPLSFYDRHCRGELEISAHAVEEPKCVKAELTGGGVVAVRIDCEFAVEIVGETKVCVVVCEGCDEKEYIYDGEYDDSGDEFDDFDSTSLMDDLD